MSLQVWLPLTGHLNNQGLSNVTVTNSGATVDNNGKIGKCYSFNGSAYFNETNIDWTNFNTLKFSLCCWYKEPSPVASGNSQMICIGTGSGWNNIRIGLLRRVTNGYPMFSVSDGSSYIGYKFTATSFSLDVWNHIAVTYNNGEIKMYINGALDKTYSTTITPILNSSQHLGIGAASNGAEKLTGYLNDVRIYDHCLSVKEVKELSKGLVLHYPLTGGGRSGDNLLSRYVSAGQNAPGSTTAGGNTQYYGDYGIKIPAINNADTYFRLFLAEKLTLNEVYTISCKVQGLLPGSQYVFPLFVQSNSAMGLLKLDHNGLCSLTFTMTYGTQTAVTVGSETVYICFMDDSSRIIASGQGEILVTDFKIEKGDHSTPWMPNSADAKYTAMGYDSTIEYDVSGYNNHAKRFDCGVDSETPRYAVCSSLLGTTVDNTSNTKTGAQYFIGNLSLTSASALTLSFWCRIKKYSRGGIFCTTISTEGDVPGTDYNTTTICNWDNIFQIKTTNKTVNLMSMFLIDNTWHLYSITYNGASVIGYRDGISISTTAATGALPTFNGLCMGLGRAGGVYRQIQEYVSDLHIYATALTAEDIAELYNTAASLANNGTLFAYEYIET